MTVARVLCIEDNHANSLLIRRVLVVEDVEVILADNADDGISLAQQERPNLILMDVNMPGKDGYAATRDIRQLPELDRIPIIALTANAMQGDKERSLDAGCDGYISKPIDVDKFPTQVMNFIKKGR